jgi:hypothetical protein
MNNRKPKAVMPLMGHRRPKTTMRYTHLSLYTRQAVHSLQAFGNIEEQEVKSQHISQQATAKNVVNKKGK